MTYVRTALVTASPRGGLGAYHRRRRGFGSVSPDEIATIGNTVGDAVGIPGAGSFVASIASIFGGNPATGANAERQAHVYSLYEAAMTDPGSSNAVAAVVNLYTMAGNLYDPIAKVQQNNPQATRTYAQQALQMLATQGWENVNSDSPVYTGVQASGVVYAPSASTGQEHAVGVNPVTTTSPLLGGGGSSTFLWLILLAGGAIVLSGQHSSASATVTHANRYRRSRHRHRRPRRAHR